VIRDILSGYLSRDATVLELRYRAVILNAQRPRENLTGVDINAGYSTMRETYPTLAADGTFHCSPIEDIIEDFDDGQFDAVYSVETPPPS